MQLFRLVERSLFEQYICELVAGLFEPLNRVLVRADSPDHGFNGRLDAAVGDQLFLLYQQPGRLELRRRLRQTDRGRDRAR